MGRRKISREVLFWGPFFHSTPLGTLKVDLNPPSRGQFSAFRQIVVLAFRFWLHFWQGSEVRTEESQRLRNGEKQHLFRRSRTSASQPSVTKQTFANLVKLMIEFSCRDAVQKPGCRKHTLWHLVFTSKTWHFKSWLPFGNVCVSRSTTGVLPFELKFTDTQTGSCKSLFISGN